MSNQKEPSSALCSSDLVSRIETLMKEASSLSGAIGKAHGSHPAMYAVNRAWHSLGIASDEMSKTMAALSEANKE